MPALPAQTYSDDFLDDYRPSPIAANPELVTAALEGMRKPVSDAQMIKDHEAMETFAKEYFNMGGDAVSNETRAEVLGASNYVTETTHEINHNDEPNADTIDNPKRATQETLQLTTAEAAKNSDSVNTGDAEAGPNPRQATSIESALAGASPSQGRNRLMVIAGNDSLRNEFYLKLQQMGVLSQRGGMKTVSISENKQLKILGELAHERGMETKELLQLSTVRDGRKGLVNKILEAAHLRMDTVRVVAVGDTKTIENKEKEIKTLVAELSKQGGFYGYDTEKPKMPENAPLQLTAQFKLHRLINVARDIVKAQNAKDQENPKSNSNKTHESSSVDKREALSKYARELPETFRELTSSKEGLAALRDKQNAGVRAIKEANLLSDPQKPEMAKQTPEVRQEFLARFAAAVEHGLDKTFGKQGVQAAEAASLKLTAMIQAEQAQDSEFSKKTASHVSKMVDAGVLTPAQAERVQATLEGKELVAVKAAPEAPADTVRETSAAKTRTEPTIGSHAGQESLKPELHTISEQKTGVAEKEHVQGSAPAAQASPVAENSSHRDNNLSAAERLVQALKEGKSGEEVSTLLNAIQNSFQPKGESAVAQIQPQAIEPNSATAQPATVVSEAPKTVVLAPSLKPANEPIAPPVATTPATTTTASAETSFAQASQPTPSQPAPTQGAKLETQSHAEQTVPSATARNFAHEQATHEAANRFVSQMSTPAKTFITRNKTWNISAIQSAANTLSQLDTQQVAKSVSREKQVALAVYGAWLADKATNGTLPGISQEQLKNVQNTASKLLENMPTVPGGNLPEQIKLTQDRLERMSTTMQARQMDRGQAERPETHISVAKINVTGPVSPADAVRTLSAHDKGDVVAAQNMAKDLVHTAYSNRQIPLKSAKHYLRNAHRISGSALRGLDMHTRARAVTALNAVARQALQGDMGLLPQATYKHAHNALNQAGEMTQQLQREPQGYTALNQAQRDLGVAQNESVRGTKRTPEATKSVRVGKTTAANDSTKSSTRQAAQTTSRSGGRGMGD